MILKKEAIIKLYVDQEMVQCKVLFTSKIKSKIYIKVINNKDFLFDIRVPYKCSYEKIEQALKNNYLNLMKIKEKKDNNSFINLNLNKIKYLGKWYDLQIVETSKRSKISIKENNFIVEVKNKSDVKKVIELFLKKQANQLIIELTYYLGNYHNLTFNEVKIKKLKKAWGNCKSQSKIISFSYYLMHFDIEIIKYVICHELSHLIHPNHSIHFWNLVSQLYPNYKYARRELKKYIA